MRWSRLRPSSVFVGSIVVSIKFYQYFISPLFPKTCRFEPSCSAYAVTALHRHGALKGVRFMICRILRCNCFSRGGYDPVPAVKRVQG